MGRHVMSEGWMFKGLGGKRKMWPPGKMWFKRWFPFLYSLGCMFLKQENVTTMFWFLGTYFHFLWSWMCVWRQDYPQPLSTQTSFEALFDDQWMKSFCLRSALSYKGGELLNSLSHWKDIPTLRDKILLSSETFVVKSAGEVASVNVLPYLVS